MVGTWKFMGGASLESVPRQVLGAMAENWLKALSRAKLAESPALGQHWLKASCGLPERLVWAVAGCSRHTNTFTTYTHI